MQPFFGYDKAQHVPGSHCSFKHFRFIRVGARRQAARIHNYKLIQSSLLSLPWLIHAGDDSTATQKCDTQRQCASSPMYLCVCKRGQEIRVKEPDLIKAIVLIYEVWPQMIHLIRWCHMRDRHVTGLAMCVTLYMQDNMKLKILSSSCQPSHHSKPVWLWQYFFFFGLSQWGPVLFWNPLTFILDKAVYTFFKISDLCSTEERLNDERG